jgi:hypothetical protein
LAKRLGSANGIDEEDDDEVNDVLEENEQLESKQANAQTTATNDVSDLNKSKSSLSKAQTIKSFGFCLQMQNKKLINKQTSIDKENVSNSSCTSTPTRPKRALQNSPANSTASHPKGSKKANSESEFLKELNETDRILNE